MAFVGNSIITSNLLVFLFCRDMAILPTLWTRKAKCAGVIRFPSSSQCSRRLMPSLLTGYFWYRTTEKTWLCGGPVALGCKGGMCFAVARHSVVWSLLTGQCCGLASLCWPHELPCWSLALIQTEYSYLYKDGVKWSRIYFRQFCCGGSKFFPCSITENCFRKAA